MQIIEAGHRHNILQAQRSHHHISNTLNAVPPFQLSGQDIGHPSLARQSERLVYRWPPQVASKEKHTATRLCYSNSKVDQGGGLPLLEGCGCKDKCVLDLHRLTRAGSGELQVCSECPIRFGCRRPRVILSDQTCIHIQVRIVCQLTILLNKPVCYLVNVEVWDYSKYRDLKVFFHVLDGAYRCIHCLKDKGHNNTQHQTH